MSTPDNDLRLDYLEITTPDPAAARAFYSAVFGWTFQSFGPDYEAWRDGRLQGGFERGEAPGAGVLPVLYTCQPLDDVQAAVVAAGGTIVKPTFSFPGGQRFEFLDPTGVRMAVWTQ